MRESQKKKQRTGNVRQSYSLTHQLKYFVTELEKTLFCCELFIIFHGNKSQVTASLFFIYFISSDCN